MRKIGLAIAVAVALAAPARAAMTEAEAKTLLASLHPQTGDVRIGTAKAVLHLGSAYYFLGPDEARRVLTEAWGNPPDSADGVLGIVLPAGKTVFDDTWGAVVTYEESGHVSDDDAKTADFNALLEQVRGDETTINEQRTKQGFPAQHLVGWAQTPTYDPASHSMVWAQDIKFGDAKVDTLNYDVRLLGRTGVLSLNMISSMADLAGTRTAAAAFGKTAAFDPGARYADFTEGDREADYGLAGLVAAGVGAVAVKKLGLLAIILGFGKKAVLLVAALAATLGSRVKKWLGKSEPRGEA